LSLQLISYLLVILENYRPENGQSLTPVAVLYLPINLSGRSRNELPPMPILESQFLDQPPIYKATGLIDGDWIKQLDHSVRPKQYSKYFNFYINKDGSVYNSKSVSVVTSDQFGALLDHCRRKLIDLADAVAHGNIAVSPYSLGLNDTPCAHCEFKSLCRFDFSTDPYRQLENYNKNEVLEKILYTHRD